MKKSLSDPNIKKAENLIEEGFKQNCIINLIGKCEVNYTGRSKSYLGLGDRIVLLKPDGSLLVHKKEKHDPVNWQPPGCEHKVSSEDSTLKIHSTRKNPKELVEIWFDKIYQLSVFNLSDSKELDHFGSEEDLRQYILKNPDIIEEKFRPIETERETPAGAVDIYGKDKEGKPVIIELKRRRVGPKAVGQLKLYVDNIKEEVRGILVSPSMTNRARDILTREDLEYIKVSLDLLKRDIEKNSKLSEFQDSKSG